MKKLLTLVIIMAAFSVWAKPTPTPSPTPTPAPEGLKPTKEMIAAQVATKIYVAAQQFSEMVKAAENGIPAQPANPQQGTPATDAIDARDIQAQLGKNFDKFKKASDEINK